MLKHVETSTCAASECHNKVSISQRFGHRENFPNKRHSLVSSDENRVAVEALSLLYIYHILTKALDLVPLTLVPGKC